MSDQLAPLTPGRVWGWTRWYGEQLVQQFIEHDCLARAGTLTYTTLFAIVPMMTVTYVVLSLFPEFSGVGQQIQTYLFQNFVPGSSALLYDKLAEFSDNSRNLTWISFGFLFVTAFMTLVTVEKTFNRIWQVPSARRGMHRLLTYWAVLTMTPALIVAGVLISVYFRALPFVSQFEDFGLGALTLGHLPKLLSVAAFTVLYYAVPNYDVPFRHALLGGVLTMLVFQVLLWAFGEVAPSLSFNVIYGAFAAIPAFLSWIYLVWVLVLCGVVFVRTLSLRRDREPTPEPLVVKAARILRLLQQRHVQGEGIGPVDLEAAVRLTRGEYDQLFDAFRALRLVHTGEDDRLFLGRDLKSLSLWDLYHVFPQGIDEATLRDIEDLPGVVEPLRAIVQFGSNAMTVDLASALSAG